MLIRSILIIVLAIISSFQGYTQYQNLYDSLSLKNFEDYKPFLKPIDTLTIDLPLLNVAIFFYTNKERIKRKKTELKYSVYLERSSELHSRLMHKDKFFGHTHPTNKTLKEPENRARAVGIRNPHIAENVLQTFVLQYKSNSNTLVDGPGRFLYEKSRKPIPVHTYLSLAEEIVDKWMHSPGHRKNILHDSAVQLGCGSTFYYDNKFNYMPTVLTTQNFQWFEEVVPK